MHSYWQAGHEGLSAVNTETEASSSSVMSAVLVSSSLKQGSSNIFLTIFFFTIS